MNQAIESLRLVLLVAAISGTPLNLLRGAIRINPPTALQGRPHGPASAISNTGSRSAVLSNIKISPSPTSNQQATQLLNQSISSLVSGAVVTKVKDMWVVQVIDSSQAIPFPWQTHEMVTNLASSNQASGRMGTLHLHDVPSQLKLLQLLARCRPGLKMKSKLGDVHFTVEIGAVQTSFCTRWVQQKSPVIVQRSSMLAFSANTRQCKDHAYAVCSNVTAGGNSQFAEGVSVIPLTTQAVVASMLMFLPRDTILHLKLDSQSLITNGLIEERNSVFEFGSGLSPQDLNTINAIRRQLAVSLDHLSCIRHDSPLTLLIHQTLAEIGSRPEVQPGLPVSTVTFATISDPNSSNTSLPGWRIMEASELVHTFSTSHLDFNQWIQDRQNEHVAAEPMMFQVHDLETQCLDQRVKRQTGEECTPRALETMLALGLLFDEGPDSRRQLESRLQPDSKIIDASDLEGHLIQTTDGVMSQHINDFFSEWGD